MKYMEVLSGVDPDSLTVEQKRKVLREVNLIKLKRIGKLKGSMCANGSPHHKFLPREEAKSNDMSQGENTSNTSSPSEEDTQGNAEEPNLRRSGRDRETPSPYEPYF